MPPSPREAASRSVLGRVFAILDAFSTEEPELTLAELSARTGIPKPTVHRIAADLVERRLLERTAGGFQLGLRLFELGELVRDQRELRDLALPFMEELFEQTHEVVHLEVLEATEVLYFVKIVGHKGIALPSRVGGRMPAHATAVGKVLLAFAPRDALRRVLAAGLKPLTPHTITDPRLLLQQLEEARRTGVAFENEEAVLGNASVAAPICGAGGHVVAALSISGPPPRLQAKRRAPAVQHAATSISRKIAEVGKGAAP